MSFSYHGREIRMKLIGYFKELDKIQDYNSGLVPDILQKALDHLEQNPDFDFSSCFVTISSTLIKMLQFEIYEGQKEVRNLILILLAKSLLPILPGENIFQESLIQEFFHLLNDNNEDQVQIAIITILIHVFQRCNYSTCFLSYENISILTNLSIEHLPVSHLLYLLLKSSNELELTSDICFRVSQIIFSIWKEISGSIFENAEEAYYSIESLIIILNIKNSDVGIGYETSFIKEIFNTLPESFEEKPIKQLLLSSIGFLGYIELDSDLYDSLLNFMSSNDEDILSHSIISLKNAINSENIHLEALNRAQRSQLIKIITEHYFNDINRVNTRKSAIEIYYYLVSDTPNEITNDIIDFLIDSIYLGSNHVLMLLREILQVRLSTDTVDDFIFKLIQIESKEDIEQMDSSYQDLLNEFFEEIHQINDEIDES